jgi:5-hydroxyisourate hydrolase-like protein (transthyretin family)
MKRTSDGICHRVCSTIPTLCVAAFFIAAATGGLAQAAPAITPATVYRIAGTVVNAVTGEPVRRATVAVLSETNREMIESVVTDNEGRFSLEGLAAGKYPLTASKRGFLTGFFDEHDGGFNSAIVTGEGQETGDLVFRLSPGATLHGVVLGDGGDPVEGASVMLFVKPHNHNPGARITQASNATTDDAGSYEFNDLAPSEYLLAVSAKPWFAMNRSAFGLRRRPESAANTTLDVAYPVTYYDSTTDEPSATRIALTAGSREEANINLRAAPALHLTLEAPSKQGAPGSWPALEQTIFGFKFPANPNTSTDSKATDTFEFSGIPPGHYQLRYGDPPRIAQMDATTSQQIDPDLGVPTMAVSGSLRASSGFVLPETLTVILIPVDDTQGRTPLQANCVKGLFTFDAVPPGVWKLFAYSPGKALSIGSISVGSNTQAGNTLTVKDKSAQIEAAVTLGETQIKGFARKNDKGLAGVMIVLVPRDPATNDDQFRRDQSDSDGSFSLRDVAPGQYTVVAIQDGWELDWARPEVIERYLPKGIAVTVTEGSGKVLRLSEGVPVQGS